MTYADIPDDKITTPALRPAHADETWNSATMPDDGALVEAFAEDDRGAYRIPFPVRFIGDKWLNDTTGRELDAYIAGWRPWKGRG